MPNDGYCGASDGYCGASDALGEPSTRRRRPFRINLARPRLLSRARLGLVLVNLLADHLHSNHVACRGADVGRIENGYLARSLPLTLLDRNPEQIDCRARISAARELTAGHEFQLEIDSLRVLCNRQLAPPQYLLHSLR